MSETKAAGRLASEPASKSLTHRIRPGHISRNEFIGSCISGALTLLVAAAEAAGDSALVDELLRLKNEQNRGRA